MSFLHLIPKDSVGDAELAAVLDAFSAVSEALGLDDGERALLLGVRHATLPLRPGRPELTRRQERRLRHVVDIGTALAVLIGDADDIVEWMRTPRASLGGATPVAIMIGSADGFAALRNELIEECRSRFGTVQGWR